MKVSQYNSIYDFPSNPSQKLMFNAKSLALALVDCSKVEIIARLTKKSRMRRF